MKERGRIEPAAPFGTAGNEHTSKNGILHSEVRT